MYVKRETVSLTTDASGDATGYTGVVNGRVLGVLYRKTDFANGVDFTVTTEVTGVNIWTESDVNASADRAPRMPTHGQDGSASLYAAAGEPVEDLIPVAEERIKVVVAQGGNVKSGTVHVLIG